MRIGLIGILLLIAAYAPCQASAFGIRVGLGGELVSYGGMGFSPLGRGVGARADFLVGRHFATSLDIGARRANEENYRGEEVTYDEWRVGIIPRASFPEQGFTLYIGAGAIWLKHREQTKARPSEFDRDFYHGVTVLGGVELPLSNRLNIDLYYRGELIVDGDPARWMNGFGASLLIRIL